MSVFSFLGNTAKTVARGNNDPGGGVFGFLHNQVTNPQQNINSGVVHQALNTVQHIPVIGRADTHIANIAKGAVQGTISAGVPIGAEIYNRAIAPAANLPQQTFHPSQFGATGTALLGNDILSPTQTFSASKQAGHGNPFSFLAAGLSVAGAIPVGGSEAKGAGGILKSLANARTAEDASKILLNNGVDKATATKIAPAIAHTPDTFTIERLLNNHIPAPTPPQVITRSPIESQELAPNVLAGKLSNKTEIVPIDSLKPGSGVLHSPIDPQTVNKYIQDVKNRRTIDPLVVSGDGKNTLLEDGKHRLEALKKLGVEEVPIVREVPSPELDKKIQGAALQSALSKAKDTLNNRDQGGFLDIGAIKPKPEQSLPSSEIIPPAAKNPLSDIADAISGKAGVKGLASVSRENKAAISQQRGARFEASKAAGSTEEGSSGYFKELHSLKGEYNTTKLGGMIENIGPGRAEELFSGVRKQIQDIPDSTFATYIKQNGKGGLHPQAAKLNLQTAMRKIIFGENGGVPTAGEIKLIKHINPELADQVSAAIPKQRKIIDFAARLAGLPRALQATFDLSMGGRQALLVAARHPALWAKANVESFKMFKNPEYYHNEMQSLRTRPSFDLGEQYGLRLPAAHGEHEEAFASPDLAEKIPLAGKVVQASSRAYDGGLSVMRMDLWDHLIKQYGGVDSVESQLGHKGMKDLAEVVNTMTGRGGKQGGLVEQHMKSLSTTLFSPRLWASRLNTLNPYYYYRLSPAARNEALQAAGSFATVAGAALLGLTAAGAEVNTDPRSSDFLKVKFGDTRYDILGGFQQNLVFAYRELSGEKTNSQTGTVTKFGRSVPEILTGQHPELDTGFGSTNRLAIGTDVVGNKLNPLLGTSAKIVQGTDKSGQPINPATEIGKLFIPLNLQGVYETSNHTQGTGAEKIAKGFAKNLPNTVGVGIQSYGVQDLAIPKGASKYIDKLKSQGAPPEAIQGAKNFYQLSKTVPNKTQTYTEIDAAVKAKDYKKAEELAAAYNEKVKSPFQDWVKQYGQYATPQLNKDYQSLKIPPDFLGTRIRLVNKGE